MKTGILIGLIIIFCLPMDLQWRYSRDQVNNILVRKVSDDSLRSAIEAWFITIENPENSTQEEIDSIENLITRKNRWTGIR